LAVFKAASMPAGIARDAVEEPLTTDGLVHALAAIVSHIIHIHSMECIVGLYGACAVLAIGAEETVPHLFTVRHRAPLAILALRLHDGTDGEAFGQVFQIDSLGFFKPAPRIELEGLYFLAVFVFRVRPVEDMELLLAQICTKETISAAFHVPRKGAVGALLAAVEEERVMAVF